MVLSQAINGEPVVAAMATREKLTRPFLRFLKRIALELMHNRIAALQACFYDATVDILPVHVVSSKQRML